MWKLIHKIKEAVVYDADRDFYAKVFPGTVAQHELLRLRRIDHADLPAMLAIEAQNYRFPWSADVFKDCLRTMTYSNWLCVAPDDTVVGYGIVSVAAGEAHIMNLSVNPNCQRQGAGRKLLHHLIEYARPRAETVFLEVRPSNLGAIALYRATGFREIGVRKGYYPADNGREDALMFALDLVPAIR